jgi:hypothetical protein
MQRQSWFVGLPLLACRDCRLGRAVGHSELADGASPWAKKYQILAKKSLLLNKQLLYLTVLIAVSTALNGLRAAAITLRTG